MNTLNESTSDTEFQPAKTYEELSRLLALHRQQHLLQFWNELSAAEQQRLASQVRAVYFAAITHVSVRKPADDDWSKLASQAKPPQAFRLNDSNAPFSAIE